MSRLLGSFLVVSALAGVASADNLQIELKELGERMTLKPEPGRVVAKPHAPAWCTGVTVEGNWTPLQLARLIDDEKRTSTESLIKAAPITCKWPNEPSVQKAVAEIEQYWINWTGLTVDKAQETIKLRMAKDRWAADKKKLCDTFGVSDEVEGEEKLFADARIKLFGCKNNESLWVEGGGYNEVDDSLATYLDSNASAPDELVRLAYLTSRTRYAHNEKDSYFDKKLISYIVDQVDFAQFTEAEVIKQLDTGAYKGNTFARGTAIETIGRLNTAMTLIRDEVKKKSSDAEWKELLVTAPQRGITDWNKAAAKWKDQIARASEFEKKFWGASKKAAKDCWPTLRKDFLDVAKTLPKSSPVEFQESLSQPVAGLLWTRLAACASLDLDQAYSRKLVALMPSVRQIRGPRSAAYYAGLEAIGKIREDRDKFPIEGTDLRALAIRDGGLYDRALKYSNDDKTPSKIDTMGFVGGDGSGMVKAIKAGKDGVAITFVTTKYKTMGQACTTTNRIIMFERDGTPIYYRKCKNTGMVTVDSTPGGITVPADWAVGIKAGAVVDFEAARGQPPGRIGFPKAVFGDKDKKKLVNFYGLPL